MHLASPLASVPPHFQAPLTTSSKVTLKVYISRRAQHNSPPGRLSRLHILTLHPSAVSPAILRLPQVLVRYLTTLPNDDSTHYFTRRELITHESLTHDPLRVVAALHVIYACVFVIPLLPPGDIPFIV
ncbi:hypothetical protein Krac_12585 [Ktedonobacter racemifer DSM 44963]|uniref:Uncharacterized protein n=1 Tax=Ktedonobacter racemifer DSM 44963 TaxID=485913 RepID=D6THX3_KTERA|nr:hypothetical protein Krac_12585 [Ktedonobacter racemifer DSM 44963]